MIDFEELPLVDFSTLKRKPLVRTDLNQIVPGETQPEETKVDIEINISSTENQLYSYEFLLKRVREQISKKNPTLTTAKAVGYPNPKIARSTGKKVLYTNISKTATYLKRQIDHIQAFIETELQVSSNLNGENQLLIRGKFDSTKISAIMEKYVEQYVKCSSCSRLNTEIAREKSSKFYVLTCNDCNSSKTVSNVRSKK